MRQHRRSEWQGNFIKKVPEKAIKCRGSRTTTSAFDDVDTYELTELGKQFVHYAMNELASQLTFTYEAADAQLAWSAFS